MAGTMVYRLPVGSPEQAHMIWLMAALSAAQGLSDNRGDNHIARFHGARRGAAPSASLRTDDLRQAMRPVPTS